MHRPERVCPDAAADTQSCRAQKAQAGRRRRCRNCGKQKEQSFSAKACPGKKLDRQDAVPGPIKHHEQNDQHRPKSGKAQQEQAGRRGQQGDVFCRKDRCRRMGTGSRKKRKPALKISTQPFQLRRIAQRVQDTGRSAPGQALGWQPPQAGTYRVRVVDDHGRSDSRALTVGLVE